MGPGGGGFCEAVLDGVEVDVIHVGSVVVVVADSVLPEATLLDGSFAFGGAALGVGGLAREGFCEGGFDEADAAGEFRVVFGEG